MFVARFCSCYLAGRESSSSKDSPSSRGINSSTMEHPALSNADILHNLLGFVDANQYIFFAPVSTTWRAAWGLQQRQTVTRFANPHTSLSQLRQSFKHDGLPRSSKVCAAIAGLGNISLIKYALQEGCEWTWQASRQASRAGHLHVLQWAQKHRLPWNTHVCEGSAEGGHLDLLKWARSNGCAWGSTTTCVAAREGHLHVLRWARAQGCPWDSATIFAAARGGHVQVLQFALDNGCEWNAWIAWGAAKGGHLEALRWAIDNGCAWNTATCEAAASGGHLDVVRWSVANGCPWNGRTCEAAARCGHVKVLRWSMENGCPFDEDRLWRQAVEGGHAEVQQWLGEQMRRLVDGGSEDDDGVEGLAQRPFGVRCRDPSNRTTSVPHASESRRDRKIGAGSRFFRKGRQLWTRAVF